MSKEQARFSFHQELGGLELLEAKYHQQNFSRHSHEGYTIGVIETGAQKFFRSGANHLAPQHSIILVNADQVHNGQTATTCGWSYRAIYPTPEQLSLITQEFEQPNYGSPYFADAVAFDPLIACNIRKLFTVLSHSKDNLERETLVFTVLSQLLQKHAKSTSGLNPVRQKANVHRALDCLHDNFEDNVSLEHLADLAHLSQFHFLRQFKLQTGLTPHNYLLQIRIRRAKQMLKTGFNITETAVRCGFHDQSHFHRHFKRALGVTPGQFKSAA